MDELDKLLNTKPDKELEDIVKEISSRGEFDMRKAIEEKFPFTHAISINDIVPEEYQHKLMEIDLTMSKCFWMIGDIANDLVNGVDRQKCAEYGVVISQSDIYKAVGYFCHRTERTIRQYWEIAHYYPLEIRQKYDVPYAMFVGARWVDNWELFLKIAESNPTWSEEKVRIEYYNYLGEKVPVREQHKEDENLPVLAPHQEEKEMPVLSLHDAQAIENLPPDKTWNGYSYRDVLLGKLDHTVDDLRSVVNRIELPAELKVRIGEVVLEIQNISLEIRREV